jgi:chemotaxis methyl-accepting protein methylase
MVRVRGDRLVAGHSAQDESAAGSSPDDWAQLASALVIVRERTGIDFGVYRRGTLLRRVRNRMTLVHARCLAEYLERLRSEPDEPRALLERLTIKVSRFFRHATAFAALKAELEARRAMQPPHRFRAWSAGCGRGEEPYSLAILLDELGQGGDGADVLATDIDERALEQAVGARYPAASLQEVDGVRRERYFRPGPGPGATAFEVQAFVRTKVELKLHDLTGETAPVDDAFDIVCCRNVLIYLQRAAQERVLERLAACLRRGGLLLLGEAEWLLPRVARRFAVVDRQGRLFARVGDGSNG